jgi:multidrug efflux pump subunit AcrB
MSMRIWVFAVRQWQFTSVFFLLLVVLGIFALRKIPTQEDPTFPIPLTTIVIVYPGADPEDVERLATDPIEDVIAELDDVKEIRSTSESGIAVIRVEFDWSVDADRKYDEVVREVNALRGQLPTDIRSIEFKKTNPGLVNIVQYAVVADHASPRMLRRIAENLENSLETVPGIRRAESWGYPAPEIRVGLNLPRMSALGLDAGTIVDAVQGEGQSIPSGAIQIAGKRYNLKGTGDYETLEEISNTVVAEREGRAIKLRDVAEIAWATEEPNYLSRFNGHRAAFVTANMKDGFSIFDVQQDLDERVEAFRQQLPMGIKIETGFVQSKNVENRLSRLIIDFLIAIALVALTLLPLGWRAGGIVMIAIPLSLAMGVSGLWALGYSLNQISIAGFVVSLGLLVDDAIVVVENISRFLRQGYDRASVAILATNQIALAVLGCTATLILAFLPLLNLPEGPGQFTRGLPLAVVLTVIASLLVAFTIVPFLASRLLPRQEPEEGTVLLQWLKRGIHRFYAPVVHRALAKPKKSLLIAATLVMLSLGLVPLLGFSLFPAADKPQVLITISTPEGSSLDATQRAVTFVEKILANTQEVRYRMVNLGRGNPQIYYNIFPLETKATNAEIFISLAEWKGDQSIRLLEKLRHQFSTYAGAIITVNQFQNGPPIEAPIAVRVIGPEISQLTQLAAEVESVLKRTVGTRDVKNALRMERVDLDLGVDTEKAGLLGIRSIDIDRTTRLAVAGFDAAQFRDERGDDFPVRLRLPINTYPTSELLNQLYFNSRTTGQAVALSQIATPHFVSGPSRIERFDRERMATVTANVAEGEITSRVSTRFYDALAKLKLPVGYRIDVGGEAESAANSLSGLGTAIIIASFGIIAVLVLEFGSFRSMLIVAGVIPFGLIGALAGLFITGYPLSYMAIIGFVALIGVEIKNSILLVDFTNQLRLEGADLDEAIEKAGELRFLPVLLTSITAIGGLLPLAASGSALYAPLAIVMIGGLLSSTLLARIITPVMYKLLPPTLTPTIAST